MTPSKSQNSLPWCPRRPSIDRAYFALLRAGWVGIRVGMVTGLCSGAIFFVVGGLVGAVWGIPVGFVAGMFGAAMGGRWGWAVAGMLSGMVGGTFLAVSFSGGLHQPFRFTEFFPLCLILVPGLGGLIAGNSIGRRLDYPKPGGTYERLFAELEASGLYQWPVPVRLSLAVAHVLSLGSFLALLSQLIRLL